MVLLSQAHEAIRSPHSGRLREAQELAFSTLAVRLCRRHGLALRQSPCPDRIAPRPGISEVDLNALQTRTLTNLCNQRPQWLAMAPHQLDLAVAACGWTGCSADMPDEEILKRLPALNLARSATIEKDHSTLIMKPSTSLDLKRRAIPAPAERFRTVHPTVFDLCGLQFELESVPGASGDLLAPADLPVKFRALVLEQLQSIRQSLR